LRGKDAEPLAGANLVDLVEQVDHVEAQFHPLEDPGVDRLHDAEIDLLVAGQAGAIWYRAVGPETAAGGQVDGKAGIGGRQFVFDAGRRGISLVMIEMDVMPGDIGQIVGREVELRRYDVLSQRLGRRKISVK